MGRCQVRCGQASARLARQIKGELAAEVAAELAMARDLADELAEREAEFGRMPVEGTVPGASPGDEGSGKHGRSRRGRLDPKPKGSIAWKRQARRWSIG